MNRSSVKFLAAVMCVALALGCCAPVLAAEPENDVLVIQSAEDLHTFARQCRLDSYSMGLTVRLEADIDLSGSDFSGIPIFCGTFDGNGHTIRGFSLDASGSQQGLFRYLTQTAVVRGLHLEGSVSPIGSAAAVGLLAGSSAGQILECTADAQVSGKDRVGGLVGINLLGGVIDGCTVSGSVNGNHFVGGIAGQNAGVIRSCKNTSAVNITAQQNNVELSDISTDTIIRSESANTVTDIGGIAGTSAGMIHSCENLGDVGYPHMGYNVGGIAGSQSGYIRDCQNHAQINGRKEVGGIVGQMEPVTSIDFREDTLQILQQQITDMSALTNQASANAQNSVSSVNQQFAALDDHVNSALEAVESLKPDLIPPLDPDQPVPPDWTPSVPDPDTINAAKNQLSSSMNAMAGTLDGIVGSTKEAAQNLSDDLQAISQQASAIGGTISSAGEYLGGTITDVSDTDTPEDTTGKVESCSNDGAVQGDLNTGGIAGAIAMENDLDHEDDWQISGYRSMNFESRMRAVITGCENKGSVTVKKRNAGGIVGLQAVGLTKSCINTGAVMADKAELVGGIAGSSTGYLRDNSVKCQLYAASHAGGIAGSATIVTGSRSMAQVICDGEKQGGILGSAAAPSEQTDTPIQDNFYLVGAEDLGGIDGISYDGLAQSQDMEQFMALERVPQSFAQVQISFAMPEGDAVTVNTTLGGSITPDQIPAVPEKEGHSGQWEGLDEDSMTHLAFDSVYHPVYTPLRTTLESELTRQADKPLLLAVGQFRPEDTLSVQPMEGSELTSADPAAVEGCRFTVNSDSPSISLHFALPADADPQSFDLLVQGSDGTWRKTDATAQGSYLVFPVTDSDTAFCILPAPQIPRWVIWGGAGVLAAAGIGALWLYRKKKKPSSPAASCQG